MSLNENKRHGCLNVDLHYREKLFPCNLYKWWKNERIWFKYVVNFQYEIKCKFNLEHSPWINLHLDMINCLVFNLIDLIDLMDIILVSKPL